MMSYLSVEWRKTQKFPMLMIGIFFLAFCSLIGLGIYLGAAYSMVAESEKVPVLWGQLTFYYSQLFFPILVSIYVAMMLGKEFDRKNIEFLRANNVSLGKLLLAKEIVIILFIAVLQLFLFGIFYVSAHLIHLEISNLFTYLKWDLLGIFGTISMMAVQFFVTAKTRVFSKSVGIGSIGTFVGFMMIFVSDKLSLIYPYSQAMVAMRSRNLTDFNLVEILLFIIVNILLWGIFHTLSNKELHK